MHGKEKRFIRRSSVKTPPHRFTLPLYITARLLFPLIFTGCNSLPLQSESLSQTLQIKNPGNQIGTHVALSLDSKGNFKATKPDPTKPFTSSGASPYLLLRVTRTDGKQRNTETKAYKAGDTAVFFQFNLLKQEVGTYIAEVLAYPDSLQSGIGWIDCHKTTTCHTSSGTRTFTVSTVSKGRYDDRPQNSPAWCSSKHKRYEKKCETFFPKLEYKIDNIPIFASFNCEVDALFSLNGKMRLQKKGTTSPIVLDQRAYSLEAESIFQSVGGSFTFTAQAEQNGLYSFNFGSNMNDSPTSLTTGIGPNLQGGTLVSAGYVTQKDVLGWSVELEISIQGSYFYKNNCYSPPSESFNHALLRNALTGAIIVVSVALVLTPPPGDEALGFAFVAQRLGVSTAPLQRSIRFVPRTPL